MARMAVHFSSASNALTACIPKSGGQTVMFNSAFVATLGGLPRMRFKDFPGVNGFGQDALGRLVLVGNAGQSRTFDDRYLDGDDVALERRWSGAVPIWVRRANRACPAARQPKCCTDRTPTNP